MFQSIRIANRVPTHRVLSTNGNQDSHPTSGFFPPTSDVSETSFTTTPPCHILSTNQETLSHKRPSTSDNIQYLRYGMEERFAFRFPVTSCVQKVHTAYYLENTLAIRDVEHPRCLDNPEQRVFDDMLRCPP
ncbi:hypothetical protein TNCV_2792571 [Trichonephila clavipes]|nr:hypothetical protein TNCV_2792571 [Trichonephila clavipes]